jgi:type I restriction-modification system DNA methylase subunit
MANEELHQRGYLATGKLKGNKFGLFEEFNIGGTTVRELKLSGLDIVIPKAVTFPFGAYKPPKNPALCRPDRIFCLRSGGKIVPIAVAEHKAPNKLRSGKEQIYAEEQVIFSGFSSNARVGIVSDGKAFRYIDIDKSIETGKISYFSDSRDFVPAVLENIYQGSASIVLDPKPLAESVWQIIWQATKEEPKTCLLTFVEIFVLKFLSDNLPLSTLPESYRFDILAGDPLSFQNTHGRSEIEYYVDTIRPKIKQLFPDNTVVHGDKIPEIFSLNTLVSKTSIINGFAFLQSSTTSLPSFNRTFLEIIREFEKFGPLTTIDPQFKLRLYETFLKRSARQQKLGQFFTPRTVVRPMVKMAQLDKLADGAVVLDPAAGVGGFILEPPLVVEGMASNVAFAKGEPQRRINLIGVDVDVNTHILAKANALIHFAEELRQPSVTLPALNQLLAQTFVLMNENATLGSLMNPPHASVDVILSNPPYVTRGSGAVKDEIRDVGVGGNGRDLREVYDRTGLGVESLFLRYIVEALKPGGRAFVIVPLGLLNRTEPGPKREILSYCNILASIALPRNTFFNTAQLTYILVLEKRHTTVDERPSVLAAIARTIGETLNWERVPTPDANDLEEIAEIFVQACSGTDAEMKPFTRFVAADQFTEDDRWDVARFWTEDERVALGLEAGAITRAEFIEEVDSEIIAIASELKAVGKEIADLQTGPVEEWAIGDATHFIVRSGTRITGAQLRANPGELPIYSCFKNERITKGYVDEGFWSELGGHLYNQPFVTINANGASIGKVFVRDQRCGITDDVISVVPRSSDISVDYLAIALQDAVNAGRFIYEAKLFVGRVRELVVHLPVKNGTLDTERQMKIAAAIKRFNTLKTRLIDLGSWSDTARTV